MAGRCARAFASAAAPVPSTVDVAIVGAGVTGAALAAALAANPLTAGLSVALLDERPPPAMPRALPAAAAQPAACLTPASVALLKRLGVWRSLAPAAAPACGAQLADSGSDGFMRCSSSSVGAAALGYTVERQLLAAALHQQLRIAAPGVRLLAPAAATGLDLPPYSPVAQLDGGPLATLHLQGGGLLQARLVVGADGRAGSVRLWAQIRAARPEGGDRRCLWATVATSWPTGATAFYRLLPTGVLALLPVHSGHSALAWVAPAEIAVQLAALPRPELAAAATDALTAPPPHPPRPRLSELLAGAFAPAAPALLQPPAVVAVVGADPVVMPASLASAGRLVRPRLALAGGAAHAVEPLPGHGVNTALADAAALAAALAAAVEAGQDLGSPAHLEAAYERPQRAAAGAAASAAATLARLLGPAGGPAAGLRGAALDLLNATPTGKQTLLRLLMGGLGGGERPPL